MANKGSTLIIAPEIVPRVNSWGGSQRMYYLANMLEKCGENVITLSPGFKTALECEDKEVLYHPVYLGGNIGDEEKAEGTEEHPRVKDKKRELILKKIKKPLYPMYMFLVMMDYFVYSEPARFQGRFYQRWLKDYKESIWECIKQNKVKKMIISGPSFELFSFAKTVKKKDESIKIIFDYRDPWHLWKKRKNLAYLKEKQYLQYADCIVCFSDAFRADMCKVFGIAINKTEVVYNGYSEEAWRKAEESKSKDKPENKRLVITYVGSMDFSDNKRNYRNPNILMRAVERQPEGMVELKFVGVNCVEGMERRNNIEYIGRVAQEESFHYMVESDVLLNIHDMDDDSGKYLVPGKFYDYMRSGRAIWNIGRADGLAARLLSEYDMGISCENDAERIEEVLGELIARKRQGRIGELRNVGGKDITGFSRERQNGKYVEVLGKL